jgi:FixJ family two-component response regulator
LSAEPCVYIVDDDPAVLDSLSVMVAAMGLQPVCHRGAHGFLLEFDPRAPGCLVLDLRLPRMSGMELLEQLAGRGNSLPVIMITGHGDVTSAVQAMKLGVVDFLEKPYSPQQLREAIRQAIELDAERRAAKSPQTQARKSLGGLTPDEREVADLIAMGHTNREIASQLDISVRTVQFRRAGIMEKLDVRTRAELVRLVLRARGLGD